MSTIKIYFAVTEDMLKGYVPDINNFSNRKERFRYSITKGTFLENALAASSQDAYNKAIQYKSEFYILSAVIFTSTLVEVLAKILSGASVYMVVEIDSVSQIKKFKFTEPAK